MFLALFSSSIYLSDVDASFVKVQCNHGCKVYFHPECSPKLKSESSTKMAKTRKPCITPDCSGFVTSVERN